MAQTVSTVDPYFVNQKLTSTEMRRLGSALVGKLPTDSSGMAAETGVLPAPGTPFGLTSNGTSSAPQVSVAPGHCVVQTSAGGTYVCTWPTAANLGFTAPAGNPRIDLVCARVQDNEADAGGSTQFSLITVDGTPAASPSAPVTPAGYLKLWEVTVATNGGLTFTDRRTFTRAAGGIRYASASDLSRNGSYNGDLRILSTGEIDVWLGSSWQIVASPTVWNQWSPPLLYSGSANQAAGTVNIGTGGTVTGRYIQIGKRLDVSYTWTFGSGGTDGGSGDIYTQLPSGLVSRAASETHILAFLYTGTNNVMSWGGTAYIPANSNKIQPRFPFGSGDCRLGNFRVANAPGAPGTGVPQIVGDYPIGPAAILTVNGTIEVQ